MTSLLFCGREDDPSHREGPIFSPSASQKVGVKSLDHVPTYLFRVHGPQTAGTTTTTKATSPACERGQETADLFEMPPEMAAQRLHSHLCWWRSHEAECNLLSWSSSLLFVLQHGFRRHRMEMRTTLSDVHVLVLDTRRFVRGTFMGEVDLLKVFSWHKGLNSLQKLRLKGEYYGEYISQGHLSVAGRCGQASLKQLNDMGLESLCPLLYQQGASKFNGLAHRVLEMRQQMDELRAEAEKKDVRTAITIAQACFGARFALPLAATLLSLRHRAHESAKVLDGLCSMFDDEEIASLGMGAIKFDPWSEWASELGQFRDLMGSLRVRVQNRELASAFQELVLN